MTTEQKKPTLLSGSSLIEALKNASDKNAIEDIAHSAVALLWRAGDSHLDLTIRGIPILGNKDEHNTASYASTALAGQLNQISKLYLLGDRYAENNQPSPGVEWDYEARTKGTILCIVACMLMLCREAEIGDYFLQHPKKLCFGMVQNETVILLPGESDRFLAFYQRNRHAIPQ